MEWSAFYYYPIIPQFDTKLGLRAEARLHGIVQ